MRLPSTFWEFRIGPTVKTLFAVIILVLVGWQFYGDLTRTDEAGNYLLTDVHWQPGWLALSAALYLVFLGSSCWYWRRLLLHFGPAPTALVTTRAYYVSQLGKYVPGKAWALIMRGTLVCGPNLRLGLAILTTFYEVLTPMAAGALLGVLAFIIQPPLRIDLYVSPVLVGILLLGVCALPLLPGVFNRIAARLAHKLQADDAGPLPRIDMATLLQGVAITACGWCLLGISIWAGLAAVSPAPPPLDVSIWLRCLGAISVAYVGGFLIPFLPGGVGAREFFLARLFGGSAAEAALFTVAVLLMRLAWTVAEVALAGLLYFAPIPAVDEKHVPSV
jgi:glycosyltransferase 2 family protein